jgi:hypothetical protein
MWCKSACYMLRIAQEDMADLLEQYPQLLTTLQALNSDRRSGGEGGAGGSGGSGGVAGAAAGGNRQATG